MKNLLSIIISTILVSCSASTKTFKVLDVELEKDGKTLILRDNKNKIYSTVISIPNENFANVIIGDSISLEIDKTIDTDPPIVISKNIQILK